MASRRDPRVLDENEDVIGNFMTPDEAREAGLTWMGRPGESDDLTSEDHYQTKDEANALGRAYTGTEREYDYGKMAPGPVRRRAGIRESDLGFGLDIGTDGGTNSGGDLGNGSDLPVLGAPRDPLNPVPPWKKMDDPNNLADIIAAILRGQ